MNSAQQQATEVTFRPVEWSDLRAIATCFSETWPPVQPMDNAAIAELMGQFWTLHYFALTSEGRVAFRSGAAAEGPLTSDDFLGVTLVRRVGHPQLFPQAVTEMERLRAIIKEDEAGANELAGLERFFAIEGMLEADSNVDLRSDTELELFLVNSSARGKGIGRALWQQFQHDLQQDGVRNFFLHTDSGCDYHFYDRHGMTRIAERLHADHPEDFEFLGVPESTDPQLDTASAIADQFIYRGEVPQPTQKH